MDLEFRALRYFVAVAEELNFTQAARRLHIAQPPLSHSIRSLESWLGTPLFVRTTRKVELTEAGQALLEDAYAILDAVDHSVSRARQAGRVAGSQLSIGFRPATSIPMLNPLVTQFRTRFPEVELDLQRVDWGSQVAWLLDGRVDLAFILEPLDHPDLDVYTIFSAPRAIGVGPDHPLVGRESISIADLSPYATGVPLGAPPEWAAFWSASPRPIDPGVPDPGPTVASSDESISVVLSGRGVVLSIATVRDYYDSFGISFVPILDIEPARVGVAWRRRNPSPSLEAFLTVVDELAGQIAEEFAAGFDLPVSGPSGPRLRPAAA